VALRRLTRSFFFTLFFFILGSFTVTASAQAANPSPDAGIEQKRFESYEKTNKTLSELQKTAKEPSLETGEKGSSSTPTENLSSGNAKVLVKKITVTGNTVISSGELSALARPCEGRELQFSDIRTVAERITHVYRSRGYLTSRAYIPPQDLEGGVVEIRILEGKLGGVKVF